MSEPFSIHIPDAVIGDLKQRINNTRWPDQIPGSGWDYGTDTAYLRELLAYWADGFDWRAVEARLNSFPHYQAEIDRLRIHYIHAPSARDDALPLLLLHGWPSSFVQMLDVLPLLNDPDNHGAPGAPAFHVVVASLPGYGFSSLPDFRGVGFPQTAARLTTLMHDILGYQRYGLRGSDLGANTSVQMALAHPEQVAGVHLSGIIGALGVSEPPRFTAAEQDFIKASAAIEGEIAYARMHMSKPQTLGQALNDSPAGLAAWIIEKFRAWGDTGGDIEFRFSKDDLLTNLMIYWATGTINSSVRMYYEFVRDRGLTGKVEVPVGMLMSHKDLFPPAPREFGERLYNVQRWTDTHVGGHFLEWEEPALVASELRAFFGTL
ncbi:MAG: epoxide hydrolase [Gammaproteobacteria bacterium]|nr:epoxide hydrolase [Gammaproteobacteria bacterium]